MLDTKYFIYHGNINHEGRKYQCYTSIGYPLILKSKYGVPLVSIQAFYADEDFKTQKCPIIVPYNNQFQIIYPTNDEEHMERPICFVVTNIHSTQCYDNIRFSVSFENPKSKKFINKINVIPLGSSYCIKSNCLDDSRELMIRSKKIISKDGKSQTVSFTEEETNETKTGSYLHFIIEPENNYSMTELYTDTYWDLGYRIFKDVGNEYDYSSEESVGGADGDGLFGDDWDDYNTSVHTAAKSLSSSKVGEVFGGVNIIKDSYYKVKNTFSDKYQSPVVKLGMSIANIETNKDEKEVNLRKSLIKYLKTINKKISATIKTYKSTECVICLSVEPDVLFLRCGHICSCSGTCSDSLATCPMCRRHIIGKLKLNQL